MMSALPLTNASEARSIVGADRPWPATSHVAALWTLYTLTLRQHLHGKRWMVMVALFLLPASIAILSRSTGRTAPSLILEFFLAFMFIPLALLPLIALLYASGMIRDEQEEQTITYLLVRPIPKWAMYCMKLLATLTTAVVLTALLTALTYAAIYVGAGGPAGEAVVRCAKAVSVHSLAVVAYCALFGLVSILTKRTLVVGIIYTAIVEGVFAILPFGIRFATVIYYTRLIAYRMLDFNITTFRGTKENFAADGWQLDVDRDPQLLAQPSIITCLLVLLFASLVFTVIAAWLCSRREFHVKVPEGD
jgi:ABC-2 type transport system permease protein